MGQFTTRLGAVLTIGLCLASQADAQVYRIADTNTPVFGGTGTFTSFDPPSTNRNALPYDPIEVSFHARGSDGSDAVFELGYDYLYHPSIPPSIGRTADLSYKISPTESLGSITNNSSRAFSGIGASGQTSGVFYQGVQNGMLNKIAVTGDANPSIFGGTFTSFGPVADIQGNVVFEGTSIGDTELPGLSYNGIYQVQNGTIVPVQYGAGPDSQYGKPAIGSSSNTPLVIAYQSYTAFGDDVMLVKVGTNAVKGVETQTEDPDVGDGELFSEPSVSGLGVFYAVHASGVTPALKAYLFSSPGTSSDAGSRVTLASTGTHVPGTAVGVTFSSFGDVSAFDFAGPSRCAFTATASNGLQGIYIDDQFGTLTKFIDTSAPFDGRMPVSFGLSSDAIEFTNLAFLVNFSDGSSGIYSTDGTLSVPEPAWGLAGLALCGIAVGARRRVREAF